MSDAFDLDLVIFGGGAAGLWLLDDAHRAGYQALLIEAYELGRGQTIASQGIIHGGLKYTLKGLFNPSADAIKQMPIIWRHCLAGDGRPHLGGTRVRAQHCFLWRTQDMSSRFGLAAATKALRVAPVKLPKEDWPPALSQCPGEVYRLDEQVISPQSFLSDLSGQNARRIIQCPPQGMHMQFDEPGNVQQIMLEHEGQALTIRAPHIVLSAGEGNAPLRQLCGLTSPKMQRRPLHMVMVRGNLPVLNGHCTDAATTRATITSDTDAAGRTVWQVGGQISEVGVKMSPQELVTHAKRELAQVLPGVDFSQAQWATYRVDRAEAITASGARPDDAQVEREGNVITAWPTKLALVPRMVRSIRELLSPPQKVAKIPVSTWADWPRPDVAQPPWEAVETWTDAP